MNRQETMSTGFGEMMDMISCLSIYNGGAEQKRESLKDYDEIMNLE